MRRGTGVTAAALAGVLVLAGCGEQSVDNTAEAPAIMEAAVPGMAGGAPPDARQATNAASNVQAPGLPQIAYVYAYQLELPTARIPTLMARHEQACTAAGPATCQVIGSSSSRVGEDALTARLEIRATPAYIAALRGRMSEDAQGAGGRVTGSSTDSEDLTRSLSDTEARMRALSTLRDRLQQLLATRSGSLEDLLRVETELARVQGELDATQSALEVMRARVATSRLTIDYGSSGQLAPDSAFRPVGEALHSALGLFMMTVGALISLLAVLAPIALIVVPLVWWLLKRRRKRKLVTAAVEPPSEAP